MSNPLTHPGRVDVDGPDSESDARKRYRIVVHTVRYNAARGTGQLLTEHEIMVHLDTYRHDADEWRAAIQAAVEQEDLVRVRRDGVAKYSPVTEPHLLGLVEQEIERDDPDRQLIATCNRLLDELRADAGEGEDST